MIVGLDRPTSGTVTVNGKPYAKHRSPLSEVEALLDAKAVHSGRSARSHLRTMAATHGISSGRVDEVIEMTGLAGVAAKRVGGFSLGMGQRLGIASAMLGDPRTLILDEPVIGRGRIIAAGAVQDVIDSVIGATVRVRSPRLGELATLLAGDGVTLTSTDDGAIDLQGVTPAQIGDTAAVHGIPLHELSSQKASVEEAYMNLTQNAVEYRSEANTGAPATTTEKGETR